MNPARAKVLSDYLNIYKSCLSMHFIFGCLFLVGQIGGSINEVVTIGFFNASIFKYDLLN